MNYNAYVIRGYPISFFIIAQNKDEATSLAELKNIKGHEIFNIINYPFNLVPFDYGTIEKEDILEWIKLSWMEAQEDGPVIYVPLDHLLEQRKLKGVFYIVNLSRIHEPGAWPEFDKWIKEIEVPAPHLRNRVSSASMYNKGG